MATPFSYVSTPSTNATNVKPHPTTLTGLLITNTSAAARFVRVYDKATAPIPASDAALIKLRFPLAAGQQAQAQFGDPLWFAAGLGFDITAAAPDGDATVTATGDVTLNMFFD